MVEYAKNPLGRLEDCLFKVFEKDLPDKRVELDKRSKDGLRKPFGNFFLKKTKKLRRDLPLEITFVDGIFDFFEDYLRLDIRPDYNTPSRIYSKVSPIAHFVADIFEKPFCYLLEFLDWTGIFNLKMRGLK